MRPLARGQGSNTQHSCLHTTDNNVDESTIYQYPMVVSQASYQMTARLMSCSCTAQAECSCVNKNINFVLAFAKPFSFLRCFLLDCGAVAVAPYDFHKSNKINTLEMTRRKNKGNHFLLPNKRSILISRTL